MYGIMGCRDGLLAYFSAGRPVARAEARRGPRVVMGSTPRWERAPRGVPRAAQRAAKRIGGLVDMCIVHILVEERGQQAEDRLPHGAPLGVRAVEHRLRAARVAEHAHGGLVLDSPIERR